MLLDANGRMLRRSIGFLPEWRAEPEPAAAVQLTDAIAGDELEAEDEEPALEECGGKKPR